MNTANAISLPFGEMVIARLTVALVVVVASWQIVRAYRRRDRRHIWKVRDEGAVGD